MILQIANKMKRSNEKITEHTKLVSRHSNRAGFKDTNPAQKHTNNIVNKLLPKRKNNLK